MGNIVTIDFHGNQLLGFENDRGLFVALKPIVEGMGIDWSSQHKRLQRDPILSEGMVIMTIPFGRGGAQEAVCLPLDLVHGWLFTVDASRIADDVTRAKVITYQRECYRVLADAFAGKAAPDPRAAPIDALPQEAARKLVTEARHTFDAIAARQLWFKLGLPTVPAMHSMPEQLLLPYYPARQGGQS